MDETNQRPPLPPSLSKIPSELDRLYADAGGPAEIRAGFGLSFFRSPCEEFRRRAVEPILSNFCNDPVAVYKHWPWVAFAADQYRFERRVRRRQAPEPQPKKVASMLDDISKSAKSLACALAKFQELGYRLGDPSAPFRSHHIAYLDQLIEQAAAGLIADHVIDDDLTVALCFLARDKFSERIIGIDIVAREAKKQLDPSALKRSRGQVRDHSLFNLVFRVSEIWISMTGRSPSAEKISSKSRESDDPDFVLLIRAIAQLADRSSPTRKQIATALTMSRPPA